MNTKKFLVHGKVQGVCYRASAAQKADQLGVVGYAKNLPNGCVEICVQGPENLISQFIAWCEQGPRLAKVEKIGPLEDFEAEPFEGFGIF